MSDFESKLHFVENVKDYASEVAEKIRKSNRDFIQFGAGITGEKALHFLRKNYELRPLCFCDNNPAKQMTEIDGVKVYSLGYIMKHFRDYWILISCDAFLEISRQLVDAGVRSEDILYIEPDMLNSPRGGGEYVKEHLQDFKSMYELLEDEKSRKVYLGVLNYKITHDLKYVDGITDTVPYFDEELIKLQPDEVFLDCGAFIGDTLLDFVKQTQGEYKGVICFEPNKDNINLLQTTIDREQIRKVKVFPYGLSDKKQTLRFGGSTENGRISDNGSEIIECDTVDNLCLCMKEKVTFIKMDIEGSEYYALNGARELIQRDHPKLAICVYHKKDDFFVLPRLIKEIYAGYKLYFRQYELSGEETVCIALPD